MLNLISEHLFNARLVRVASITPEASPFKRLLVAWAKLAGVQEDQFLRISYIEGALGVTPNSIVRKPYQHLVAAREAISSGSYESDPIAKRLITELGMSPEMALNMVSNQDQGFWRALVSASSSQLRPTGTIRGVPAEAIVNSLAFGVSPITGEWLKYGQGKGLMYWLGANSYPGVTLSGIRSIAFKEVVNRTKDFVRGTREEDKGAISLDAPLGSEGDTALLEVLQEGGKNFDEDLVSILGYNQTLEVIDPLVRSFLRTHTQITVWEILLQNPDLITTTHDEVGMRAREVAKIFAAKTGEEYTGGSRDVVLAKVFKDAVLPAMFKALKKESTIKQLMRNRELLDVMRSEMSRKTQFSNTKNIGISGVPKFATLSDRAALIRLASTFGAATKERKILLKLAEDIQNLLKKDANPASQDQNKPESYYGFSE